MLILLGVVAVRTDLSSVQSGVETEPEFLGSISNVTYPAGREAVLSCTVRNLGKYKVSGESIIQNSSKYV